MKRISLLLIFILPAIAFSQEKPLKWFKGNTHTHSLWSDGNDYPEMIMDWYKSRGYDFISLSDHNTLAAGEKWVKIPNQPIRQARFKEYLQKFGKDWVVYKSDSVGIISVKLKTLEEYRPKFEAKGKFLIMQAEEISDKYQSKPIHIGAVNIKEVIKPQGGNSVTEVMQNNIDEVYAQRKKTGEPMIAHINHPNFKWAIKIEDMMNLKGDRFFEIHNGHPHVHNHGDSETIGMEELWDKLLIHYIENGRDLVYGLATDDAHDFLEHKTGKSNPGRGWIMVRASELKPAALIEAMEKGDFYSSTGVELDEMSFDNQTLKIGVKAKQGVQYTIQFWGANKSKGGKEKAGVLLKEVKGSKATYKLSNENLFVRAKIISTKLKANPYEEGEFETAWTQPVIRN
ncbi:MAG: hypothetical protein ACO1N7_13120 [Sphingobacteriaceae bacterium]